MNELKIGNRLVAITNPDRVLFGKSGITKGQMIDYYRRIAPIMLPYIKDHPITMHRYPDGIDHEGFYQKDVSNYFPAWIKTEPIAKKEGGVVHYVVINNAATLVYLANQACIVMHAWTSKIDKLHYPARMIFDLDPSTKDFSHVRKTALAIRAHLENLNITSFVMTTGSRGLHVVVPLKRNHTNEEVVAGRKSSLKK